LMTEQLCYLVRNEMSLQGTEARNCLVANIPNAFRTPFDWKAS